MKNKFYRKIAEAGVIKILITNPLTVETMQQLIIMPWRRSYDPGAVKNDLKKVKKIQKT